MRIACECVNVHFAIQTSYLPGKDRVRKKSGTQSPARKKDPGEQRRLRTVFVNGKKTANTQAEAAGACLGLTGGRDDRLHGR